MQEKNHNYICIDLKSFYASVECIERSLDPLNTNLVVADSSRTEKTICLAVSPSLKSTTTFSDWIPSGRISSSVRGTGFDPGPTKPVTPRVLRTTYQVSSFITMLIRT